MKYYFENPDSEVCYTKQYFLEEMKDREITEMQVYPARIIIGELFAWCMKNQTTMETQNGNCGRFCKDYSPRNGKNGRCRFSKNCYEPMDIPIKLTL